MVDRLSEVSVKEDSKAVEVGAWVEDLGEAASRDCGSIGVAVEAQVNLAAPLGDRRLVDIACRLESNQIRFERCRDGDS